MAKAKTVAFALKLAIPADAKDNGDDEDHAYLMKRAKSLGYKEPKP